MCVCVCIYILYIYVCSKVKGKVYPRTGRESPDMEERCNSTLPSTSALDGGGWSTPRPGHFTPQGKTRYILYRRLCGPHSRSGRVRKISPPPGFDPRTVQPVASRYTDWDIPAHICVVLFGKYFLQIPMCRSLVRQRLQYTPKRWNDCNKLYGYTPKF